MDHPDNHRLQNDVKKISALKAYWEKCAVIHDHPKVLNFQQHRAIFRNPDPNTENVPKPWTTGQLNKDRAKTTVDFGAGLTSVGRYQVSSYDKQVLERGLNTRNCMSALDERRPQGQLKAFPVTWRDDTRKREDLDFTEKLKSFKALFTVKRNPIRDERKDVHIEEIKDSGSQLQFTARSRQSHVDDPSEAYSPNEMFNQGPNKMGQESKTQYLSPKPMGQSKEFFSKIESVSNSTYEYPHPNDPDFDHVTYLADVRALNFSMLETKSFNQPLQNHCNSLDMMRSRDNVDEATIVKNSETQKYNSSDDVIANMDSKVTKTLGRKENTADVVLGSELKHSGYRKVIKRDNNVIGRGHATAKQASMINIYDATQLQTNTKSVVEQDVIVHVNGGSRKSNETYVIPSVTSLAKSNYSNLTMEKTMPRSELTMIPERGGFLMHQRLADRSKSATPSSARSTEGQDNLLMTQIKSHLSVLSASLECLSNIVSNGQESDSGSEYTGGLLPWGERSVSAPQCVLHKLNSPLPVSPLPGNVLTGGSDHSDGLGTKLRLGTRKQTNVHVLDDLSESDIILEGKSKNHDKTLITDTQFLSEENATESQLTSDLLRKQELRKMIKYIHKQSQCLRANQNQNENIEIPQVFKKENRDHSLPQPQDKRDKEQKSSVFSDVRPVKGKVISRNMTLETRSAKVTTSVVAVKDNALNNEREYNKNTNKNYEELHKYKNYDHQGEPRIMKRNSQLVEDKQPVRSQSEVFFRNALKETYRQSPLPSKSNISTALKISRPKSALEVLPSSQIHLYRHTDKQIIAKDKKVISRKKDENKRRVKHLKPENVDVKSSIKEKLEKLHFEIDQRLSSRENLTHYVRNFRLKDDDVCSVIDLKSGVSNKVMSATSSSDDTLEAETTSMVSHLSVSEPSSISNDATEDEGVFKHKLTAINNSSEFITSTPVKNVKSQEEQQNTESENRLLHFTKKQPKKEAWQSDVLSSASSVPYRGKDLKHNFDREIDHTYSSNHSVNIFQVSSETAKHLGDKDIDLKSLSLQRSGSFGSQVKHTKDKKEIVSRILSKMVTRHDQAHISGTADLKIRAGNRPTAGRESPAERLLSHLDNPRLVKLLQMLYQADPMTRQIIMMKVQYFTAWHELTVASRERRIKKIQLNKQCYVFNAARLLTSHLNFWKQRSRFSINVKKADAMFRRHMLVKGFKALQWSVSLSMHLLQRHQAKYHSNLLNGAFSHWKLKSVIQRRQRKESSFQRWKQFVQETLKVRLMQKTIKRNKMVDVLRRWKKVFIKRKKCNRAQRFYRMNLMSHTFASWEDFIGTCKSKKNKYKLAMLQYEKSLQARMFFVFVEEFKQCQKIRTYFRLHLMRKTFASWHVISKIFKVERNADEEASVQHWKVKKLQHTFSTWYEQLRIKKAEKMSNFHICKNLFHLWKRSWQDNIEFRCQVDQIMLRKKLHRAFLRWRQNVVYMKKRRKLAVLLIENCHMKQSFMCWKNLMILKKDLRGKVSLHKKIYKMKTVKSSFNKWKELCLHRKKVKTAKKIFSEACARKMFTKWRLTCHKRSLTKILETSQPQRETMFLRFYFTSWLNSMAKRSKEHCKADEYIRSLESKKLKTAFLFWLNETKKMMKIKPIGIERKRRDMANIFISWLCLVQHKSECKKNLIVFQQRVLQSYFNSWKRQLKISHIAKEIEHRMSQGLLLVVLDSWRFFSSRKKSSKMFRERLMIKHIFFTWKSRANELLTNRTKLQEELDSNMDLKRWSFLMWRENVTYQKTWMSKTLMCCIEKQQSSSLSHCFYLWRKLLHSSLIAKAYHRNFCVKLMGTYFISWQQLTYNSFTDAVHVFSEKIGQISGLNLSNETQNADFFNCQEENTYMDKISFDDFGSSNEGLQIDKTLEIDRRKLLSVAIEAAKEDRQIKCQKLKANVTRAIVRLMNWPLSVAFEQWREYSMRQSELKAASAALHSINQQTLTILAFKGWKNIYLKEVVAKHFWTVHALKKYFQAVRIFKDYRKYVKHLAKTAHHYRMLQSFKKFFPVWQCKAEDRHQKNYILHLWTCDTPREMELCHLEHSLTRRITNRTLLICFSHWFIKYKAISKIRYVYSCNLLQWVYVSWKDWALGKHLLSMKSQHFLHHRQSKMTFRKWCQRLEQKRKSKQMYEQAWNNYLLLILQQWKHWSKTIHQLQLLQKWFAKTQSHKKLLACFTTWKTITVKIQHFHCISKQKLLYRMLIEWRTAVRDIKVQQNVVLQFQIHSFTLLVKRLFYKWHDALKYRQKFYQERQSLIESRALNFALSWKKKAQKSRSLRLKSHFEHNKLAECFKHWLTSLSRVHVLHNILEGWLKKKHGLSIKVFLRAWKVQLLGLQARKNFQHQILFTFFLEWKSWTRISRERQLRGLVLKKALQERNLHIYFDYWVAMTRVKLSVQHNIEFKLQIRIFRAWRKYSRQQHNMRYLHAIVTHKVNTRVVQNTFMIMRWRADYCASLNDIADKLVHDREVATMKAVIALWKDRLHRIEAVRCYQQILTVRVLRRWHKFVLKKHSEHQREQDNMKKAINKHNMFLCKSVMRALKQQVAITKMVEKRKKRICEMFAKSWKGKVDLRITAIELEREFNLRKFWSKWRNEYIRYSAAHKICHQQEEHILRQIFKAWQKLSSKSALAEQANTSIKSTLAEQANTSIKSTLSEQRVSLLPVPVSQPKISTGPKSVPKL